jgi:hypothetical protein
MVHKKGTCNHFHTDSKVKSSAYGFSTIMTGRVKEREKTNKLPRSTRTFLGPFRYFLNDEGI